MAGKFDEYTMALINRFGVEYLEELQRLKREGKKFTRGELLDIIDTLKQQLKELGE